MGGADGADGTGVLDSFQLRQVLAPVHQVVDLVEIDSPAEQPQRLLHLPSSVSDGCRPHFGCDECAIAPGLQRAGENVLGFAVHRRGVEETRPGAQRCIHDCAGVCLRAGAAHVERAPRPHPDHGHVESGLPKASMLEFLSRHRTRSSRVYVRTPNSQRLPLPQLSTAPLRETWELDY